MSENITAFEYTGWWKFSAFTVLQLRSSFFWDVVLCPRRMQNPS